MMCSSIDKRLLLGDWSRKCVVKFAHVKATVRQVLGGRNVLSRL